MSPSGRRPAIATGASAVDARQERAAGSTPTTSGVRATARDDLGTPPAADRRADLRDQLQRPVVARARSPWRAGRMPCAWSSSRIGARVRRPEPHREERDREHRPCTASRRPANAAGASGHPRRPPRPRGATRRWSRTGPRAARGARGDASTREPNKPSSAGSSVSAATTVNATAIAAATATPYRKLTRSATCPASRCTTIAPANSTARPDVSSDSTVASSRLCPRSSACGSG